MITYADAIREARELRSERGDNPEYDRALRELLARLFPITGDTEADADVHWRRVEAGEVSA